MSAIKRDSMLVAADHALEKDLSDSEDADE